ncbi:Plasmid stabilization system protein [Phycisphaerae bacterium RAS1]|nr:Plasmid stabilization system protein [Phycisphaerae bacterium RAS1]
MSPRLIEVHPDADSEIAEALTWYLAIERGLANRLADEIGAARSEAAEHPQRARRYLNGTRRILLHSFPFLMVYRERANDIQIVALAHASRRPGYWKDRLR